MINKALPFRSGEQLEYIGSVIDVHEQELAERELQESEIHFRQMADAIAQMIWITDAAGMHEYYNQRSYDFTGTTFEHTIDEGWNQMFHPDDQERAWAKWRYSLSTGEPYEIEYRLRDATGVYKWVLGRAEPFRNNAGQIVKWFGTCTDIHDQKLLQEQKDEFISIASHELKTPVTSLSAVLQFLKKQMQTNIALEPKLAKLVDSALNNTSKITGLISDLLDVTKIEQGQLILSKSTFDIAALISNVIEEVPGTNEHIKFDSSVPLPWFGDELKIEQVLVNLISNAVKYAPASDVIINLENEPDEITVSIKDFGPGIPQEQLPFLFDRYYRVNQHDKRASGLGLGLYICEQIINKHGGRLFVLSKVGEGSTFSFTLPK